jgi:hypothetical protein
MNSLDELIKALSMIDEPKQIEIEYRIHYNEDGSISMCSNHDHPIGTTYIVVTKEEYDNYFKYTVVNGKLKKIDHNPGTRALLQKSNNGYLVVKNHAALLLDGGEEYPNTEHYDNRNN